MFIGIDIGGSKVRVASSLTGHRIDHSVRFATPTNQRRALPLMEHAIKNLVGQADIDAIGVASPGPIDKKTGKILAPINLAWKNLEIIKPLQKRFNCPVVLEHDATCGAIAEARMGSAKHKKVILYVTISTGLGTSLIVDGHPLPGPNHSEGGKILLDPSYLHNHGLAGTFENIVSGSAIKRRFGKIAAEIDNPHDWTLISHDLAQGLFNLIVSTAPDIVVLAGGVSVHYKKFARPLARELARLKPLYLYKLPKIVPAQYVETAPVLGAILLAADLT